MSARKVVIAPERFYSADVEALVGKHPAVVRPGNIPAGTRLWSDDEIVLAHPTLFVDASIVPPPNGSSGGATPGIGVSMSDRPSGEKWQAIVTVYRAWLERPGNSGQKPDQAEIAAELRIGERTLVTWLRKECGRPINDWRDVHALVLGEP